LHRKSGISKIDMELLETQDPEKRKLLETSERHRRELEKEVSDITQRTEKVLTNALIVGGVLAVAYFAVSQFSKGKSKKKKHKKQKTKGAADGEIVEAELVSTPATPSLLSEIGTKVINQATLMLIDIAREKLMEYLEKRKQNDPS
jgi:hypothetical protein